MHKVSIDTNFLNLQNIPELLVSCDDNSLICDDQLKFSSMYNPKYLTAFFFSIKALLMVNVKGAEIDFWRTLLISIQGLFKKFVDCLNCAALICSRCIRLVSLG